MNRIELLLVSEVFLVLTKIQNYYLKNYQLFSVSPEIVHLNIEVCALYYLYKIY